MEIFLYAYCMHKNCRFGEVSFPAPVYKSSRISATQRPIRNKFGTNVEKGRLVRNPQNSFCRLWSLSNFRVDGHNYVTCSSTRVRRTDVNVPRRCNLIFRLIVCINFNYYLLFFACIYLYYCVFYFYKYFTL